METNDNGTTSETWQETGLKNVYTAIFRVRYGAQENENRTF